MRSTRSALSISLPRPAPRTVAPLPTTAQVSWRKRSLASSGSSSGSRYCRAFWLLRPPSVPSKWLMDVAFVSTMVATCRSLESGRRVHRTTVWMFGWSRKYWLCRPGVSACPCPRHMPHGIRRRTSAGRSTLYDCSSSADIMDRRCTSVTSTCPFNAASHVNAPWPRRYTSAEYRALPGDTTNCTLIILPMAVDLRHSLTRADSTSASSSCTQ
mmetsp:Transcript_15645/g.48983  ORF Transcript_15645/g.48983 Transcript_15645/m.48983 type:complete len:213 (+) Transcript_15645:1736-2374(+)